MWCKKICILFLLIFISYSSSLADPGDTIKVQTFTFGSPQDAWFELPSLDIEVAKILMKYTLKCNPAQSPACGEWDYLTYTYLYDHTGVLDSTLLSHPNFEVNGTSPDVLDYSAEPTFTLTHNWQYHVVYDDILSFDSTQIGSGDLNIAFPFSSNMPRAKSQLIWSAYELNAAGLNAGAITGIRVYMETPGSALHNLHIGLAQLTDTIFTDAFVNLDFTEVFLHDINPAGYGWVSIPFTDSFTWDGVSSLVAEISFDNADYGNSTIIRGSNVEFNRSIFTSGDDKYLEVKNPMYADVIGTPLSDVTDAITIAYWSYGDPDFQPQNGTTFEAYNSSGNRLLNVHGPWSDGNIYWDAGASGGGYDRIYKNAPALDYEGSWTHWAFTKDASAGVMKIYKNGVEWHSGSGKTLSMADAAVMRLGKGLWGGSESYYGFIDEFAVWNTVLDVSTIQQYMYRNLDDAHPNADNLQMYYPFDSVSGWTVDDFSNANNPLSMFGAQARLFPAQQIFRNAIVSTIRPDIIWEQGEYISHIDSVLITDTVWNDAMTVVIFDPENPTLGIDTFQVWPGNYWNYIYSEAGVLIDSVFIETSDVLIKENYTYYSAPFEVIDRYELARYITPYGIGLDLGDGFTWTFDLSDYRPLLHDSVHLTAGNWQELLDMELWFIEGTPHRKPLTVTNLWTGFKGYDTDENFDLNTPPIEINIPEDAVNSRIKVRVSGHGFGGTLNCAEFCNKEHFFKVNGDIVWTQEVWRDDCDLNPVYPQGGTWVYDRANWCPGAEVGTYDIELTPHVTPGGTFIFDYSAEEYEWNGTGSFPYYQTEVQLITYAAPSFDQDAAIVDIIAPTTNDMWSRKNPICNNPIIRVQNTGVQTITALEIYYGLKNDAPDAPPRSIYHWSGNIETMEYADIMLHDFAWIDSDIFEVEISNVNHKLDVNELNNKMHTPVSLPATFPNSIIIEFKTNSRPNENDVFLYDALGNEVFARTSFSANTVHKDTIALTDGCYELYVWDYDEDGISWWANSDGSGYFRVRDGFTGSIIKNYQADFGGLIYEQFTVGNYVDVNNEPATTNSLQIYPIPAQNEVFFHLQLGAKETTVLQVYDFNGKLVYNAAIAQPQDQTMLLDVSAFTSGLYMAIVSAGDVLLKQAFIVEH